MNELPPPAPAGWYPDPAGGQRYWDGSSWLVIPPPTAAPVQLPIAPTFSASRKSSKRGLVALAVAVFLIGAVGLGGYAAKNASNATKAVAVAEQSAKTRDDNAAAAKTEADLQETEKATKAEEAKKARAAKEKAERILRKESVTEIEKSVKKMARGHVKDDIIDGPIVDVSCDPVAGGSVDDLTEKTTVFQCFVANKKNKDGTMNGYYYNATMNWKTGNYTYGYGKP